MMPKHSTPLSEGSPADPENTDPEGAPRDDAAKNAIPADPGGETDDGADGGAEGGEDLAIRATRDHGARLLTLAAEGIGRSLREGALTAPRLDAEPPPLRENGASFVTLSRAGALRGCIGSPAAYRPLAVDVIANAWAAATRDPRFSRITPSELPALALSVAVLTRPHRMRVIDEDDLIAQLTPGVDGLILSDRGRRGLFLPQVWESLADPRDFVAHLKRKAGFPPDYWSPTLTLDRFTARSVARPFTEPRPPFA